MLINERRALAVAGGMLAGAVVVCLLVAAPTTFAWVQTIDDWAYDVAGSMQTRWITVIAEGFSLIGSTLVNWPLRIAAFALLIWRRHWLSLAAFALAVITSEVLIGVLKNIYDRPRPPDSMIETSGASFPSGHAIAGAVTAVGLVLCLLPPGRRRWQWELYAIWFALFMALSRVYLHAHWLSDVVAGVLIGGGLALGWPALLQSGRARVHARANRVRTEP